MTNIRTIGGMWLAGVALLFAGVVSYGFAFTLDLAVPGVAAILFLGVAVPLLLLAWGAALCKAIAEEDGAWAVGLLFVPGIVMWLYLFARIEPAKERPPQPHDPSEPLGMRQARVVVEEVEGREPPNY